MIASPSTLMPLLRTVAYAWQQETVAESARETAKLGRELYDRLGVFASHFAKVGKGLESAVKTYNDAASSLERRLLVTGRKFQELAVSGDELPEAKQIEHMPVTSGDLVALPTAESDAA
jgi:DNA recombination protein RmuC